jgi:hypothetical protein
MTLPLDIQTPVPVAPVAGAGTSAGPVGGEDTLTSAGPATHRVVGIDLSLTCTGIAFRDRALSSGSATSVSASSPLSHTTARTKWTRT